MSIYLSNQDVHPTGAEPAEFLDPPTEGYGDYPEALPTRAESVPDASVTSWPE